MKMSIKFSKLWLYLLALLLQAGTAIAQGSLKGQVTDSAGIPLSNVSVSVKNTSKGTVTDQRGNFILSAPSGSVLIFSIIGYASQEVEATTNSPLNVRLQSAAGNTEVVVTALGIRKEKKALGFATQEVKGSAMEKPGNQMWWLV